MQHALLMPKFGLTMTEGLLAEWRVQAGQAFAQGDVLCVVETDKVANEVTANAPGILHTIHIPAGTMADVGTTLAWWEGINNDAPAENARSATTTTTTQQRTIASPLVRRLAATHGIDLSTVTGTGPRGRIVARDLPALHADPAATQVKSPTAPGQSAQHTTENDAAASLQPASDLTDGIQRLTPSARQAAMARRITQSKREIPHFYLTVDADVSRLLALRQELNQHYTPRLTLSHFVVQAVSRSLRAHPWANRVWHDDSMLAFEHINIGLAVHTPQGLVSPVLDHIGALGLGALARRMNAMIARVRDSGMRPEDKHPAAITVSNLGMHQVRYVGAIIPPEQAMILGVGSTQAVFRPDANSQPTLCHALGLVLSADHRLFDGVAALQFLHTVQNLLEEPARLLLD